MHLVGLYMQNPRPYIPLKSQFVEALRHLSTNFVNRAELMRIEFFVGKITYDVRVNAPNCGVVLSGFNREESGDIEGICEIK